MVDIAPFKALRPLTTQHVSDVSHFICPPYDVISQDERRAMVKAKPNNVVQVELPEGDVQDKYVKAGTLLETWIDQHIVQEDRVPSFYVLETTYKIQDAFAPQKLLKRYGVLVALKIETPRKGAVKPHEITLAKAKVERLNLIRSVKTHVSPVFGLFIDAEKKWPFWVKSIVSKKPLAVGQEKENLDHRLWKVEDPSSQEKLQMLLKKKNIYIADGHHRYEVSWAYREERRKMTKPSPQAGWNYVMAYVCPMEEPGLLMLPTHRLVQTPLSFDAWAKRLSRWFDMTPVSSMESLVKILATAKTRTLGFTSKEGAFALTLKKSISVSMLFPKKPKSLQALDVVLLHDVILKGVKTGDFVKDKDLIYTRDLNEMKNVINKNSGWVGFLVAGSGVQSLAAVAGEGQVMPAKSTYFYPKVPTGFTLMAVDQKVIA